MCCSSPKARRLEIEKETVLQCEYEGKENQFPSPKASNFALEVSDFSFNWLASRLGNQ